MLLEGIQIQTKLRRPPSVQDGHCSSARLRLLLDERRLSCEMLLYLV